MGKLNIVNVGLSVGVLFAAFGLAWSALVAAGLAQDVIAFVHRVNFLGEAPQVAPFDIVLAGQLLGYGLVTGFLMGALFALIWNVLFASPAQAGAKSSGAKSVPAAKPAH